jgi:CRISPR/Cas system type I-B associated protein Csh2 (Cas7 group RAMP superfamily)
VLIANDREQEEELKEMGLKDPKASIKKKANTCTMDIRNFQN